MAKTKMSTLLDRVANTVERNFEGSNRAQVRDFLASCDRLADHLDRKASMASIDRATKKVSLAIQKALENPQGVRSGQIKDMLSVMWNTLRDRWLRSGKVPSEKTGEFQFLKPMRALAPVIDALDELLDAWSEMPEGERDGAFIRWIPKGWDKLYVQIKKWGEEKRPVPSGDW